MIKKISIYQHAVALGITFGDSAEGERRFAANHGEAGNQRIENPGVFVCVSGGRPRYRQADKRKRYVTPVGSRADSCRTKCDIQNQR